MLSQLLSLGGRLLGRGKLSILIYHQVLAEFDPMRPTEPIATRFDWQMQLLARYFTPLSLTEAVEHLKNNTLPANAVCVTFDDGYLNNLTVAQPILAKYNIPATVYVATAFSQGNNMWNDRIIDLCADRNFSSLIVYGEIIELTDVKSREALANRLLKELRVLPNEDKLCKVTQLYHDNNASEYPARMMTPQHIKELSKRGITIGAHTVNHPILKKISAEAQLKEIVDSKHTLQQWLDKEVLHFAYPFGVENRDFDNTTVKCIEQAGFCSAVATDWGYSTIETNLHKLKRFTPWDPNPTMFHLRLLKNILY